MNSGSRILTQNNFDINAYTPFRYINKSATTSANVWNTVYTVNGKGYLDKACLNTGAQSYNLYMKIYIDNNLVFYQCCNNNKNGCLIKEKDMFFYSASSIWTTKLYSDYTGIFVTEISNVASYGTINGDNKSIIIPYPLFFNSSLKIDIMGNSTSLITNYIDVSGGVL